MCFLVRPNVLFSPIRVYPLLLRILYYRGRERDQDSQVPSDKVSGIGQDPMVVCAISGLKGSPTNCICVSWKQQPHYHQKFSPDSRDIHDWAIGRQIIDWW